MFMRIDMDIADLGAMQIAYEGFLVSTNTNSNNDDQF